MLATNKRADRILLYARNKSQCDSINTEHKNPHRFSDVLLPENLSATTSVVEAVEGATLVILTLPAQILPSFVANHRSEFKAGIPLVSTAKGIHVESHQLMSDALAGALAERSDEIPLCYLSGPSFAKEMMQSHPMALILASKTIAEATRVQQIMSCLKFRLYTSDDVIGVELGGALKNPAAIGAGIAQGLGFGASTVAGIVTRCNKEMRELAVKMGGRPETLVGLSGIGDLMLTCFSTLSRNNRLGGMIAAGKTTAEAFEEIGEVVEGVPTADEIVRLADLHGLRMPLFRCVAAILAGKIKAIDGLKMANKEQPGEEDYV